MDPKAHAAAGALRQLSVAVKTASLYPPSYPGNVRAVEALLNVLRAYMEVYGPFSVRVTKEALSVGGLVIDGQASTSLAHSLYRRKVLQVIILPTVSQPELAAFVGIVGMEPTKLEEGGGIEKLLADAGVHDIQVKELALRADEEVEVLGLNAFFSLLGRGRLSPEEREQVVEILRAGSEQVGKFLQNFYTLAGEVQDDSTEEGKVQHVCQAIRSLDRLILDEPFDQHQPLYANLAGAPLLLGESLGSRVVRALFSGAGEDIAVQVILDHLSSEQLAKMILMTLEVGKGNVVTQLASVLSGLALDREKAKGVVSILSTSLPLKGERGDALTSAVGLQFPLSGTVEAPPPVIEFDESDTAISEEELERHLREARGIDEAGATRESIKTLVDVLCTETDERELGDIADTLAGYLSWLLERRELALLRKILKGLKSIAMRAEGVRAEVVSGLLANIAEGPFLSSLLVALWEGRETPVEQDIKACVEVLADELVGPLVQALGSEPRASMRGMLCDLLVRVGREHVDELGAFVTDDRWYLVRNIAYILGRIRSPQGVAYLGRVAQHSDSRVRTEAVDALASIGTDDAQALIARFLNDLELAVRLRALTSLDARGMRVALPTLLALLEVRDPLNRMFVLKQAGIEAVARLHAREALPALRRLAQAQLVLSRRGRELRRLAQMAIGIIGEATIEDQAISVAGGGRGRAT